MISAHIENLTAQAIEELKPLLPVHYTELSEHGLAGIPLDPQYDIYIDRAMAGQVIYIALRDAGVLVGYLVSFVASGLHYKSCLTCTGDIFFVYPDKRGQQAGVVLFTEWLAECRRRGVRLAQIGLKVKHLKYARPLIEAMGFEETEVMFWQFLDREA